VSSLLENIANKRLFSQNYIQNCVFFCEKANVFIFEVKITEIYCLIEYNVSVYFYIINLSWKYVDVFYLLILKKNIFCNKFCQDNRTNITLLIGFKLIEIEIDKRSCLALA
jgi:hypothetical protein